MWINNVNTMPTLTKRQKQILDFISGYIKKRGISPTLDEIKRRFRLSALSTVHQHVEALIGKGYLFKNDNSSRGIEIKKTINDFIQIPIVGTIAAGQPIEAIEVQSEMIAVPKNELGKFGEHYALRVQGDSMINEGIFDGDIVIIRKQASADNGQTVVAIIDDNEATLKKLYKERGRIRLQPANQTMLPIFRKEVEVREVVIKIVRNLENGVKDNTSDGIVHHVPHGEIKMVSNLSKQFARVNLNIGIS